ncbi:GGDEF domain-containing protein [Methylobacterium hispanicum]
MADHPASDPRRTRQRMPEDALLRPAPVPCIDGPVSAFAATGPAALAHWHRVFEQASATARVGLWECRLSDEALSWSGAVYDLFGLRRGAPLRRGAILECYAPGSLDRLQRLRRTAIRTRTGFRFDAEIVARTGERRWIRLTAAVACENGTPARLYGMKQDVTAELSEAQRLRRLAERDTMTGLANRALFEQRLAAAAGGPAGAALLLVDLDGFKQINDGHGHAAGDLCLVESGARLARICVAAELVARIGGDEFVVLLKDERDRDAPERLADRIIAALNKPIWRDGQSFRLGASVGIARSGGCTGPEWLARADQALYAAKAAGRNTFRSFDRYGGASAGPGRRIPPEARIWIG